MDMMDLMASIRDGFHVLKFLNYDERLWYRLAASLFEAGYFKASLEVLTDMVSLAANERSKSAACLVQMGQVEEAQKLLGAVRKQEQPEPDARLKNALLIGKYDDRLDGGNPAKPMDGRERDEVKDLAMWIIKDKIRNDDALESLGEALLRVDMGKESGEIGRYVEHYSRNAVDPLMNLMCAAGIRSKDWTRAKALADKILQLAPYHSVAHAAVGVWHRTQKNLDESDRMFKKCRQYYNQSWLAAERIAELAESANIRQEADKWRKILTEKSRIKNMAFDAVVDDLFETAPQAVGAKA